MKTLEETERQTNLRVVEKMIVEIYKDSGEWRPGDVEDGSGEREREAQESGELVMSYLKRCFWKCH